MKKKLLFLLLLITSFFIAPAQTSTTASTSLTSSKAYSKINNSGGSIIGGVVDSTTLKPVEYATISLLSTDNVATNGTVCNDNGKFNLSHLPYRKYKIVINSLGYQSKSINITINTSKAVNIGIILLKSTTQLLNEVTVSGERDIVESKTDRLVYNAEKDISAAGGTAIDVLQKAPLVNVDLDGNIKLRGTNNVKVLINGKPSSIFAVNTADALRQIPAEQIKSIEILTSPSAKYDAEGSGGIVNIILKKGNLQGLNGNFSNSIGTRNSSIGLTEEFKKNKLDLSLNAGLNGFYTRRGANLEQQSFPALSQPASALLEQQRFQRSLGINGYGQLSVDYELTPNDIVSAAIQGSFLNYRVNANLASQYLATNLPSYYDNYSRAILNANKYLNLDFNLGYAKTFAKKQELNFLALYVSGRGNVNYNLSENRYDLTDYKESSSNINPNHEITLQVDYTQPIKKSANIDLGLKTVLRDIESDFTVYFDSLRGDGNLLDPSRSNKFSYKQNVYSAYASYNTLLFSDYTVKLGIRAEQTTSAGDFATYTNNIKNNYFNLIPNVTIARAFGEKKTSKLRVTYTRRLQRPSIYYLNPFINTQDKQNISAGNPFLGPELTSSYEFGLSTLIKSVNLNAVAYARITDKAIEDISRLVPASTIYATNSTEEVRFITYQNIAANAAYGVSIATNVKLMSRLAASLNSTINYLRINSVSLNTINAGVVATLNLNIRWSFNDRLTSQFTYGFNSRSFELQRVISGYQTHSLSFRKELLNKRGTWSIIFDNPLYSFITIKSTLSAPGLEATNNAYVYMRGIRASLSLPLGGKSTNNSRSTKSIDNTDQKQGKNDWQ